MGSKTYQTYIAFTTAPHLYPLETVLFLIDDGFLVPTAKNLPFGWVPLHRRPASSLRTAFDQIKGIWDNIPADHFSDDCIDVSSCRKGAFKNMILSLIGIWSTQTRQRLSCYRTAQHEDVVGPVHATSYADKQTLTWTTTELLDTRSMLPLALQCRFHEALLMEKAMRIIEKIPRLVPIAARVDGIYFKATDEPSMLQLEAVASRHRYPVTERCTYQIKNAELGSVPVNPQSWNYTRIQCPKQKPWIRSTDPRFEQICQTLTAWRADEVLDEQERTLRVILKLGGGADWSLAQLAPANRW